MQILTTSKGNQSLKRQGWGYEGEQELKLTLTPNRFSLKKKKKKSGTVRDVTLFINGYRKSTRDLVYFRF